MLTSNNFSLMVEQLAPRGCAYEWDNCGYNLLTHDEIRGVYVCLDVTHEAIDEALRLECDTILSHHPLLFKAVKNIDFKNPVTAMLMRATQANLNIYCAHTSYDCARGGLNFKLAETLGISNPKILSKTDNAKFAKVVTFVPEDDCEKICDLMFEAGAGHIGRYSHCAFTSSGVGSFLPHEGTNPTIGQVGQMQFVKETRIEAIIPGDKLGKLLAVIEFSHPYEEPVMDVYELAHPYGSSGIGCFGEIKEMSAKDFVAHVKESLGCQSVRVSGEVGSISKVACVGGSGGEFFAAAKAKGAQAIVTGEAKYNQFYEAQAMGIMLIEAGHYETEALFIKEMSGYLQMRINELQYNVHVCECPTGMPYVYR